MPSRLLGTHSGGNQLVAAALIAVSGAGQHLVLQWSKHDKAFQIAGAEGQQPQCKGRIRFPPGQLRTDVVQKQALLCGPLPCTPPTL